MRLTPALCLLLLSCGQQPPSLTDAPAVEVGRRGDLLVSTAPPAPKGVPEQLRAPAPLDREPALRAWRASADANSALALARAYFPESAPSAAAPPPGLAPVNPASALRVKLPQSPGGPLELSTRGLSFTVVEHRPGEARSALVRGAIPGTASYGARSLWGALEASSSGDFWLTQRAESFDVLDDLSQPWRSILEVTLPPSISAVRDAGDYLEFLDASGTPLLRFHFPVARDASGQGRHGTVKLQGVGPAQGPAPLRYAVLGHLLRVDMRVEFEGLKAPVVVDPGWSSTGALAQAHYQHTATLLPNGKVLVAGGTGLASAELYDPASGAWASTGSLAQARSQHTATLLPNGKVLVTGGGLPSAELYDPAFGTWASTGSPALARSGHTSTLLPNGKVLITGGSGTTGVSTSAELYDPASSAWTSAGSLSQARYNATATLLPNGKVLVTGGSNSLSSYSSELYDPASGSWISTGALLQARFNATATLLPNGKVLVTSGSSAPSSAELYDPASGNWVLTTPPAQARSYATATLLPNGKVLVTGGSGYIAPSELYDPASNAWTSSGSLALGRYLHSATLLPNGKVLVAGGYGASGALTSAELYDPGSGAWASTASLAQVRNRHTTTLLPNGKVLVVGGDGTNGSHLASAELYDLASGTWTSTASLAQARSQHTASLLPSGKVLVAGGQGDSGILASAELYDPASGAWASAPSLAQARELHTATLLPNGKVLVTCGYGTSGALASAELYDSTSGAWTPTGPLAQARYRHAATLLSNGKVLVTGGLGASSSLASAELYDPASGAWASTVSLAQARDSHTATLLPNGKVLVVGGLGASGALASAEVYDPVLITWAAASSLTQARSQHTATLLLNGKVLVAAGAGNSSAFASAEMYDPISGAWTAAVPLAQARFLHTATLLPNGNVLVAGGSSDAFTSLASAGLYDDAGASNTWRPVLSTFTPGSAVEPGTALSVTGSRFRGISEGSSGATNSSAADFPLLRLVNLENQQVLPLPVSSFSATTFTTTLPNVPYGHYLLSVTVNAISGGQVLVLRFLPPPDTTLASAPPTLSNSSTASFTFASAEAGSTFQCSLDNGAFSACASPQAYSGLADGSHTFQARAVGITGKVDPTPASTTWSVDTVAPAPPSVALPAQNARILPGALLVSGMAEANSTVVVMLDSTALGTATAGADGAWSLAPSTSLAGGVHALSATATDLAGNTSQPSPAVSFSFQQKRYYGLSCSISDGPAGAWSWLAAALGLWLSRLRAVRGALHRRRGGMPRQLAGSRALLVIFFALVLLPAGDASARVQPPPNSHNSFIPTVINLYEDLEYESALSTLQKALDVRGNSRSELVWLYQMKGVLLARLQREPEAVKAFKRAFAFEPDAQLPVKLTPDLVKPLEQAHSKAVAARSSSSSPPASSQPRTPLPPDNTPDRASAPTNPPPQATPTPAPPPPEAHVEAPPPQATPAAAPSFPEVRDEPSSPALPPHGLSFGLALRGEVDLAGGGFLPAITAELLYNRVSDSAFTASAALTFLLQQAPGLRAEGRLSYVALTVHPYAGLGASVFQPGASVRLSLGADWPLGPQLHVFADLAYERFLSQDIRYTPDALLASLGAGWRF